MPPLTKTATTRSVRTADYLLHTPESFVRTPMPGLVNGTAIVHACPELGARFLWFTLELAPGGTITASAHNRFFFMLEGSATLSQHGGETPLLPGNYAYGTALAAMALTATSAARCVVIDKVYESLPDVHEEVSAFVRAEDFFPSTPLSGDPDVMVRTLMPPDMQFDFAVNTMTYTPGAALPQVEIHYMEHGCLMLEGEGLYLLGDRWHPVQAGDFIWMAPYCPQQFAATGGVPAKYLIYKNFNRIPAL